MSDPIADMLTRMRNAGKAKLLEVSMPSSKIKSAIAEVLKQSGYVDDWRVEEDGPKKVLTVVLKYKKEGRKAEELVIEGLRRISKPSCRVYVDCDHIPRVLNGLGIAVLSTSQGIMSGRMARKKNTGGEVLCYVW